MSFELLDWTDTDDYSGLGVRLLWHDLIVRKSQQFPVSTLVHFWEPWKMPLVTSICSNRLIDTPQEFV